MNIEAEKLELVKLILETDNPGILKSIKKLFQKNSTNDFWETLSQEQKDDILSGIEDLANDDVVAYESFIKKHR